MTTPADFRNYVIGRYQIDVKSNGQHTGLQIHQLKNADKVKVVIASLLNRGEIYFKTGVTSQYSPFPYTIFVAVVESLARLNCAFDKVPDCVEGKHCGTTLRLKLVQQNSAIA